MGQVVATVTVLVVIPAHAGRSSGAPGSAKMGAGVASRPTRAVTGQVVEVRRLSREVTVRTAQGTLQRVVIPREASVSAPHGESGLSGIRSGMVVRLVEGTDSHGRLVAHTVVAQLKAEVEPEGRRARDRVTPQ